MLIADAKQAEALDWDKPGGLPPAKGPDAFGGRVPQPAWVKPGAPFRPRPPAKDAMLKTETPSSQHQDLDLYPVAELVSALVDDQFEAVNAVRAAAPDLARAVEAALPRMLDGRGLVCGGAGPHGRGFCRPGPGRGSTGSPWPWTRATGSA